MDVSNNRVQIQIMTDDLDFMYQCLADLFGRPTTIANMNSQVEGVISNGKILYVFRPDYAYTEDRIMRLIKANGLYIVQDTQTAQSRQIVVAYYRPYGK